MFIDTHCHIHSLDYPLSVAEVEANAAKAGVERFICVGTDAEDSELAVQFVKNRAHARASVGLHPHDADLGQAAFNRLAALLSGADAEKIVAVGECGLDYFYENSSKNDQEKALRYQIELALEHNRPMIFHVRDAFDDFWPIFDDYKGVRGAVHSFTDTQENLHELLSRDLYVGVNGIITFTKNDWQLEVAKSIPLEKLLLETDAPYLTPEPFRGTVNEPARVRTVAEFLAHLRGESLEQLAKASTQNARQLFSLT